MKTLAVFGLLLFASSVHAQSLFDVSPILTCAAYYSAESVRYDGVDKSRRINLSQQLIDIAKQRHGADLVSEHLGKLQNEIVRIMDKSGLGVYGFLNKYDKIEECRSLVRSEGIYWNLYD